jgi:hypothetical protein
MRVAKAARDFRTQFYYDGPGNQNGDRFLPLGRTLCADVHAADAGESEFRAPPPPSRRL